MNENWNLPQQSEPGGDHPLRYAILFRGHARRTKGDYTEEFVYSKTWPNIHSCIYEPLLAEGHTIGTYFSLHHSDLDNEVAAALRPAAHAFLGDEVGQFDGYLRGLQLLTRAEPRPDFIVAPRLDLFFKKKITDFGFDLRKFNFCWREPTKQFTCDVIHAFPYRYLEQFLKVIEMVQETEAACRWIGQLMIDPIIHALLDADEIHYAEKNAYTSGTRGAGVFNKNPIYVVFGPYEFEDHPEATPGRPE